MKRLVILGGVLILGMAAALLFVPARDAIPEEPPALREPTAMKLSSPAFRHNESIPRKFTCDGDNVSPPLAISGVPQDAKSLALIMDDPDAPRGTWIHWVVLNLDPATAEIAEGITLPAAQLGMTTFDRTGYGGPCPPSGTHRYFFKLYALDASFSAPRELSPTREQVERAMDGHILDRAELVGLYRRGA